MTLKNLRIRVWVRIKEEKEAGNGAKKQQQMVDITGSNRENIHNRSN
jgi:hypothetical protein